MSKDDDAPFAFMERAARLGERREAEQGSLLTFCLCNTVRSGMRAYICDDCKLVRFSEHRNNDMNILARHDGH